MKDWRPQTDGKGSIKNKWKYWKKYMKLSKGCAANENGILVLWGKQSQDEACFT